MRKLKTWRVSGTANDRPFTVKVREPDHAAAIRRVAGTSKAIVQITECVLANEGPSAADVAVAIAQLKKELNSPQVRKVVEGGGK